jgi:hypothetical protein
MKRHAIVYRENPEKIFEIVVAGEQIKETHPVFYHMGCSFPSDMYTVRELTEDEIIEHITSKPNEKVLSRREREYNLWKSANDNALQNGLKDFYVGTTKYVTIDPEIFIPLRDKALSEGKFNFEYNGSTVSVYHLV